ncbi:MAG: DUF370 domain-containing protein [Oscillospiraceae bacterium]|nr:DUF370 domain-containing protein [Oscillospiraceae bacterium]
MFLFLGGEVSVRSDDIVGIFDIEECSVSRMTADYLNACQRSGRIVNVSEDMPKSFVVTVDKTYISNVSHSTIVKRGK